MRSRVAFGIRRLGWVFIGLGWRVDGEPTFTVVDAFTMGVETGRRRALEAVGSIHTGDEANSRP